MELMAAGVVGVASTVTARESEERHCCHAGGAKNHAEYVEVHLFSSRKSEGPSRQCAETRIPGRITRTGILYHAFLLRIRSASWVSILSVMLLYGFGTFFREDVAWCQEQYT